MPIFALGTSLGSFRDYYVCSGLLRSGMLRSGLLRKGKLRSAPLTVINSLKNFNGENKVFKLGCYSRGFSFLSCYKSQVAALLS
jgi:hypothetical protein